MFEIAVSKRQFPNWRKHFACAYLTEACGFRVSEPTEPKPV